MKINFCFTNHWLCLKDCIEFNLFSFVIDYSEKNYKYIELTILNFEFSWCFKK
jgi:hypothetical protein